MNDLLWLGLGSAVFTSIAAIGARSLREFSRHDLQEICEKRDQLARFSQILHGHDRVALAIEMLVVLGSATFIAAVGAGLLERQGLARPPGWLAIAGGAVALGLVLATLKTWVPWSVCRLWAAPFLYHSWWLWRALAMLLAPLVVGASVLDAVLHRLAGRTPAPMDEESLEEEIRTIVSEGHREGLLEEDAREMIEGVMELGDVDVDHIMTPRTDMHMLQADTPWTEMLDDVITAGHTRIPVFDGNRDDLVGVLYVKDLLPELAKPPAEPRQSLRELVRKPVFVPETKAVNELLQMFQQTRTHIAMVLDEYGGVAGLVTIEDVLEEIVGEIVDEYDAEVEDEIRLVDADRCEALGRAHIDEINEALGVALPEDGDYDTIGGFVFSELGRVPSAGEEVDWEGAVRITVVEVSKRRVERVTIERVEAATPRESA
ncbi:MAG: hemolysin family protein [Planctomycetota bacterium]